MAFPRKFRELIELREDQVVVPDYVWLAYSVCAVEESSCGWRGWILESAWKQPNEKCVEDVAVEADNEQHCPMCGKTLFRTEVEKQFWLNPNAEPKNPFSYDTAPIEYE